jgi:hypothetical protein
MNKSYKIIPTEIKSQILADLAIPGHKVTELAKIYKTSTTWGSTPESQIFLILLLLITTQHKSKINNI